MNSKKRLARLLVLGMTLWGTYAGASLAEAADAGMHVDQVGYLTNADKKAMVTDSADTSFTIVDAATQPAAQQDNTYPAAGGVGAVGSIFWARLIWSRSASTCQAR